MLKLLYSAAEGLGSAVPIGLGSIVWIGYRIGPEVIPSLVLAMFFGIAATSIAGMFSGRPLIYTVRFFEASLLVSFVDSFSTKLGAWGLVDTPSVRLTLVALVVVGAAALQPVFYTLRLQRMTRYVPAPVFAGFTNGVALILVIGQVRQMRSIFEGTAGLFMPSFLIAAACLVFAYAVKRRWPHLPAGILGLAAASAWAFLLQFVVPSMPSVMPAGVQWVLPISWLDWSILDASRVRVAAMLLDVGIASFLLAVVMFLSTIIASETVSQVDDKPSPSLRHTLQTSAGQILVACLGSVPMSGTASGTLAAMRPGELERANLIVLAILALACYAFGLLSSVPEAAIIGLLIFEAWCMFDRPSVQDIWRWLSDRCARHDMSGMRKEDLLIIELVTLSAVVINMLAALVLGVVLGLFLFAKRNGKTPIRDVHGGDMWRSNCARSTSDTQLLVQHGSRIQCVRLQGALYFGMAGALRTELEALQPQPDWLVLDWRGVVSQDTTVLRMFERFEQAASSRGVRIVHCSRPGHENAYPDLDRALESCENQLLESLRTSPMPSASQDSWLSGLLAGLEPSAQGLLRACLEHRVFAADDCILRKGDRSRELHLIVQGRADVVIEEGAIRLAGVSAGAILGEMGFLDGTPRSATVQAVEPVHSQVLSRERFDALSRSHPEITQRVMQNLCTEMAIRLRSMHGLIARER
ncbi:SLC26A/SulP transporter family protein [Lacisediminimonas profundi]|uniref:SLC26A/SulP transporter family protein n=1 Tax=Lacisediminimonas profundi TaxID=2603856 RepID=UPI00124AF1BF|nr:cyclic nucleotide-binding domain-containing protein [Lacisediminimonas profundi]